MGQLSFQLEVNWKVVISHDDEASLNLYLAVVVSPLSSHPGTFKRYIIAGIRGGKTSTRVGVFETFMTLDPNLVRKFHLRQFFYVYLKNQGYE